MTSDVPFGFESREQYEQTIRLPLGPEWNSSQAQNNLTAPKVVTKMGRIINPLKMQGSGGGSGGKKKAAAGAGGSGKKK
jgi:U3 small nucleolar RNA-associated protein 14